MVAESELFANVISPGTQLRSWICGHGSQHKYANKVADVLENIKQRRIQSSRWQMESDEGLTLASDIMTQKTTPVRKKALGGPILLRVAFRSLSAE